MASGPINSPFSVSSMVARMTNGVRQSFFGCQISDPLSCCRKFPTEIFFGMLFIPPTHLYTTVTNSACSRRVATAYYESIYLTTYKPIPAYKPIPTPVT